MEGEAGPTPTLEIARIADESSGLARTTSDLARVSIARLALAHRAHDLIPPAHLGQPNGVLEALKHRLAAVGVDVRLAREQVPQRLRDEDSSAPALAAMREAMMTVDPNRSPFSWMGCILPDVCINFA